MRGIKTNISRTEPSSSDLAEAELSCLALEKYCIYIDCQCYLQRFVGDRIMLRQCCKLLRRPVTISHHNTVRAASSQAGGGGGVKVINRIPLPCLHSSQFSRSWLGQCWSPLELQAVWSVTVRWMKTSERRWRKACPALEIFSMQFWGRKHL